VTDNVRKPRRRSAFSRNSARMAQAGRVKIEIGSHRRTRQNSSRYSISTAAVTRNAAAGAPRTGSPSRPLTTHANSARWSGDGAVGLRDVRQIDSFS